MSALELKEVGNSLFKAGQFDEAIKSYSQAISLCNKSNVSSCWNLINIYIATILILIPSLIERRWK